MQIAIIAVCILVLFRIQAIIYRLKWNSNLYVDVRFEKSQVTEGEPVMVEELFENRKWLPLPVVFLQFKLSKHFQVAGERCKKGEDRYSRNELLSVMMNQRFRRRIEVVCHKRGIYDIERASVVAKSLLLDEEYMDTFQCDSRLKVYPRMVDAGRFENMLRSSAGGQVTQPFMQEDPFLLQGIRDYQIYDHMKSINWKATARTGSMKVNVVETVSSRDAYVFLNMQKESLAVSNEVLEESIRLAKTFCAMFSQKGVKSSLYTNGTNGENMEPVCVRHGIGAEYMSRVNEALTQIYVDETGNHISHGRDQEVDFVEKYASTIEKCAQDGRVVILSNCQDAAMVEMLSNLHRKGLKFLWIVPVGRSGEYKTIHLLREHMRMWRLEFEGANKEWNTPA